MTHSNPSSLRSIVKFKVLCVGNEFVRAQGQPPQQGFPWNVLTHTDNFSFSEGVALGRALDIVIQDQDVDLVFLDADPEMLAELDTFMTQVREIRLDLPVIVFTADEDDTMRRLMRAGAAWHFTRDSNRIESLITEIQEYVFSPINWDDILDQYADDTIKPRVELGLSYADLEALDSHPEERYIIKRLFAGSDVVQIFRLDEGFSGSRIYAVRPAQQLKRILKIETMDALKMVREKLERLIQPRLDRQIGQIWGKVILARHYGGTCYTLAGSSTDTMTLTKFMQNSNLVRRELIESIFEQLQSSLLDRLYEGRRGVELRYWAPLYARVLPPELILNEATVVHPEQQDAKFVLSSDELSTFSAVPGNKTLQAIREAARNVQKPDVILRNFEICELDTKQGILYLHDSLSARHLSLPEVNAKDHPILRFKVQLKESEHSRLADPVFRRGKRICVRGKVIGSQETVLARSIEQTIERAYDFQAGDFELGGASFVAPLKTVHFFLWEVGRKDMIIPTPQVSPVVHGDLNSSNILVEVNGEIAVWLIDFTESRPGHIYLDLAKLEVEFRTHVLYDLFKEIVKEEIWDDKTATQFALLIEETLFSTVDKSFADFVTELREYKPEWYDELDTLFPLYFQNLLYFLHRLRATARRYNPERFRYHYPVAIFFQSISALKFNNLGKDPWSPWAKRLALCCALVSGKHALKEIEKPRELATITDALKQRSAFAIIPIGRGEKRKYLIQWNDNWKVFNLIGGKMDDLKGDRGLFARTIQRELDEELGIKNSRDYRIVQEFRPLTMHQFSQRECFFKDYEFHIFKIMFLPQHPMTPEEYNQVAQRFHPERENILVSPSEIGRLRTVSGDDISETTKIVLQKAGEILPDDGIRFVPLAFHLKDDRVRVSRGRAKLTGYLVNPPFTNRAEDIILRVQPSPMYEIEDYSTMIRIDRLEPGENKEVHFWLQPKEKEATVGIEATYYHGVRGQEYKEFFEERIKFQVGSLRYIDNPYVVGTPLMVTSESLFVGREDVFTWIEMNLVGKTQSNVLILYGQRKMGKTSALHQLVSGQRGQTIREYPTSPVYPVYIDMQGLAGHDASSIFQRFGQLIVSTLMGRGIIVSPLSLGENIFSAFGDFLDQVTKNLPDRGLLVLIMDEFEQLQESIDLGKLEAEIFPHLRSLVQHRPRLTFVLAGSHRLKEIAQDDASTLFHVGLSREITALSRQDTEKLIRDPVTPIVQYDDPAVERVWLATRGNPYFVQFICYEIITALNLEDRGDKVVNVSDVNRIISKIVTGADDHLHYLWSDRTKDEKLILAALSGSPEASEERMTRLDIIRTLGAALPEDAANQALTRLMDHRLILAHSFQRQIRPETTDSEDWQPSSTSQDYTYSISFDLLRQWIARKHPLGSLLP